MAYYTSIFEQNCFNFFKNFSMTKPYIREQNEDKLFGNDKCACMAFKNLRKSLLAQVVTFEEPRDYV